MPAPKDPEKRKLWKENISRAMIGRIFTQEHKDNVSKAKKGKCTGKDSSGFGRKRPDLAEWNRANKGKFVGKKHPLFGRKRPDVAARMKQLIGDKNPAYIDGRSCEPYTPEFNKQLKELIRNRDGYKCQKCGCSEIE
ncbi:unnamed protein product, partial [marine sediment metagenome]